MSSTDTPPSPNNLVPQDLDTIDYTEGVTRRDYYLIGTVLLAVTLVGTIFNAVAVVVFIKYRELRSPTISFIIALCVCDFFMSLIGCSIPAFYAFMETYITSSVLCSLDAFSVYFLSCTSIYLLAAISVDRYFIIVKPVASFTMTQRAANCSIALCFILGFLWAMAPLVGWNAYSLEGIGLACSVTWNKREWHYTSFIVALFIGCFTLPVMIMSFCYICIVVKVRQIFRGTTIRSLRKQYAVESRLIKVIIVMILLFLASWIPYAVVSFSMAFGVRPDLSRLVETIPALVAKTSCIWNPIVYVIMNSKFREALLSSMPLCGRYIVTPESECTDGAGDDLANNKDPVDDRGTRESNGRKKSMERRSGNGRNALSPTRTTCTRVSRLHMSELNPSIAVISHNEDTAGKVNGEATGAHLFVDTKAVGGGTTIPDVTAVSNANGSSEAQVFHDIEGSAALVLDSNNSEDCSKTEEGKDFKSVPGTATLTQALLPQPEYLKTSFVWMNFKKRRNIKTGPFASVSAENLTDAGRGTMSMSERGNCDSGKAHLLMKKKNKKSRSEPQLHPFHEILAEPGSARPCNKISASEITVHYKATGPKTLSEVETHIRPMRNLKHNIIRSKSYTELLRNGLRRFKRSSMPECSI